MSYLVLGAWLIQSAAGITLLAGWLNHGRPKAAVVVGHAGTSVVALGLWVVFVATGHAIWGWIAVGLITIGNGVGDHLLVERWRRQTSSRAAFFTDYTRTIGSVFAGRLPGQVTFHAIFAGVVYFSALASCIMASMS
jgi:hypothetical protein